MRCCVRFIISQTFQGSRHYLHTNMSLKPLVFSGPSGSGKSTLVKRLMKEHPSVFAFSVSHTTRQPRPGEQNGREYHFVERDDMMKAVGNGEFVEYAEFSGNVYGTSKKAIEDVRKTGRLCILDVDMQGVKSIKNTNLDPIYIFVKPPSMGVLEERLRSRGTETEEAIKKRLDTAKLEIKYGDQPGSYDYTIVNDDLHVAYSRLEGILSATISQAKNNLFSAR